MGRRAWQTPFLVLSAFILYNLGCGQQTTEPQQEAQSVEPQFAKGGKGAVGKAEPNPIGCTQDQLARWDEATGTWVCSNGYFGQSCASGAVIGFTAEGDIICSSNGEAELCDGLDNDGNGLVDEDFPELGTLCDGPDTDFCTEGTYICSPDGLGTVCSDATSNSVEDCGDGIDNDCDGLVDGDDDECSSICETLNCTDGVACTVDACDELAGSCTFTPDDSFCDDGLSCTIGTCDPFNQSGDGCGYELQANTCLIDGVCYAPGDQHPTDPSQVCDPTRDPYGWSISGRE